MTVSKRFYFAFLKLPQRLFHLVYCKVETGNLSGSIIFMINALSGCLINRAGSSEQSSLSSFLIVSINCSVNLLYSGLNAGTDCFVTISSGLINKDSFLRRFDISQCFSPPLLFGFIALKPDTDVFNAHIRYTFYSYDPVLSRVSRVFVGFYSQKRRYAPHDHKRMKDVYAVRRILSTNEVFFGKMS